MRNALPPFFVAMLCTFYAGAANAQTYPSRTVTIVTPAAPGLPSDVVARLLAERLRERLGQPFVVMNRAGASGNLGAAAAARAAPDGYTLLVTNDAPIVVNPAIYDKLPYDPLKDFQPVAMIGDGGDVVLAVHPDSPARTVRELVDSMRRDPAKANYVSSGNGFPSHIVAELFKREGKFDAVHIPAKGAGAATQELLSGRVSFSFPPVNVAVQNAKSGKIRLLAVASAKRNPLLPDVPTFAESGMPGVEPVHYWIACLMPAGTPKSIVGTLNAEIQRIAKSPEHRSLLERLGLAPSELTPEEIAERIRNDLAYWRAKVKPLGIKAD